MRQTIELEPALADGAVVAWKRAGPQGPDSFALDLAAGGADPKDGEFVRF
jgi:hypothetical protein